MAGAPTLFTEELANRICEKIATGKSLVTICKEEYISYTSVSKWLNDKDKEEFSSNYARARESQADYIAENILDIADDITLPSDDKRIRIDARKWYAGKLRPKRYGEKVQQEVSGPDGKPIEGKIEIIHVRANEVSSQVPAVGDNKE